MGHAFICRDGREIDPLADALRSAIPRKQRERLHVACTRHACTGHRSHRSSKFVRRLLQPLRSLRTQVSTVNVAQVRSDACLRGTTNSTLELLHPPRKRPVRTRIYMMCILYATTFSSTGQAYLTPPSPGDRTKTSQRSLWGQRSVGRFRGSQTSRSGKAKPHLPSASV